MKMGKLALAGAAVLTAAVLSGEALAAPTCSTTNVLPANGQSIIPIASFTSGYCVRIQDKLYGNFNIGNLPSAMVVIFNLNTLGANDYYQIAFSGAYTPGANNSVHNYNWSYEVAVTGAVPGTKIVELDADFTQTAGGPSVLSEDITQGGINAIHEVKNGAIATGTTTYVFNPGITDLVIDMHLADKGTVSSVTNTIVQFVPGRNFIPEPLTLSLFGAGLLGLGGLRRKRRG